MPNELEVVLSELVKRIEALEKPRTLTNVILPDEGSLRPPVLASDPVSPEEGDIWYNSTSHTWKGRKNGSTVTFTTS